MTLDGKLAALEAEEIPEPPLRVKSIPKGWEPGVVMEGGRGVLTTSTLTEPPEDWSDLLRERGLDPERYEVVGDTIKWCSYDGWKRDAPGEDAYSALCFSYRAEIRLKPQFAARQDLSLEQLYVETRKHKPARSRRKGGDSTHVVALSDWQVGNPDMDGVQAQIDAIAALPEKIADELADLRRGGCQIGRLVLAGLGDLGEGTCFAGETEVITDQGIFAIDQLAAKGSATIKTDYGAWVEAEFRSFGVQPLLRVTLSRGGRSRKVVHATAEHRWFRLENPSANGGRIEVVTSELKPGDMLVSNFGKHPHSLSPVGVMAGYVFGDGHRQDATRRSKGSAAYLHRYDWNLLRFFKGHPTSAPEPHPETKWATTEMSDRIKVSGMPSFFKDLPPLDESLPYLYGWAAGYFAADGSVSGGSVRLVSVERSHLEHFAAICARIGIGTNPIQEWQNQTLSGAPMHAITLLPSTISADFFVHERKRAAFEEMQAKKSEPGRFTFQKNRARCWRVESIETTERVEEVYCAVVPGTQSFTLANDILTGNCNFYPSQTWRVELDRREQTRVVRRGIRDIIREAARHVEEVQVLAAPGNHGENRKDGKAYTTVNDNDDVAVFEQVAEVIAESEAYDNVRFRLAGEEVVVATHVSGQTIAFTHGHVPKPRSGAVPTLWGWWSDHAMGRAIPALADADILIAGHFHHLNIKEQEGRLLVVAPSLTQVGEYFANANGVRTAAGTLSLVVAPDGWGHLHIL